MRAVFVRCRAMVATLLLTVFVVHTAYARTARPVSHGNPATRFVAWILGKVGIPPGNPDPTPEDVAKVAKSNAPK